MSFITEMLCSQEAELTGTVRAMQTKRYNTWKASLYGFMNRKRRIVYQYGRVHFSSNTATALC